MLLTKSCWQSNGRNGIGAQDEEEEGERLDVVARLMGGIAELDDLNAMRDQLGRLLQHKILEVAESQSKVAGSGNARKVTFLAVRFLFGGMVC